MTILNAEEIEQQRKEVHEKVRRRIRKIKKVKATFLVSAVLFKRFKTRACVRDEKMSDIVNGMILNYLENTKK